MEEELVMNTEPVAEEQPQEQPQETEVEIPVDSDGSVSLDSILNANAEGTETEQPAEQEETEQQDETPDFEVRTRENKALRGRYNEDVRKGVQAQLQELRAEWAAETKQMIADAVAPFREAQIESEAQKLVASRQVANIELAREVARMRQGLPPQAQEQPQQAQPQTQTPLRDERGRFVQNQSDPVAARAKELSQQAAEIQRTYGIDVMAAFRENETVRQNVGNGKWDFKDAAIYLSANRQTKKPTAPPAVRSANGDRTSAHLTDRDMDAIDRAIAKGQKVRLY